LTHAIRGGECDDRISVFLQLEILFTANRRIAQKIGYHCRNLIFILIPPESPLFFFEPQAFKSFKSFLDMGCTLMVSVILNVILKIIYLQEYRVLFR